MGDLGADGRTVLKRIWKKFGMMAWAELLVNSMRLHCGEGGGLFHGGHAFRKR
jgi:hypothetical protein